MHLTFLASLNLVAEAEISRGPKTSNQGCHLSYLYFKSTVYSIIKSFYTRKTFRIIILLLVLPR